MNIVGLSEIIYIYIYIFSLIEWTLNGARDEFPIPLYTISGIIELLNRGGGGGGGGGGERRTGGTFPPQIHPCQYIVSAL